MEKNFIELAIKILHWAALSTEIPIFMKRVLFSTVEIFEKGASLVMQVSCCVFLV